MGEQFLRPVDDVAAYINASTMSVSMGALFQIIDRRHIRSGPVSMRSRGGSHEGQVLVQGLRDAVASCSVAEQHEVTHNDESRTGSLEKINETAYLGSLNV